MEWLILIGGTYALVPFGIYVGRLYDTWLQGRACQRGECQTKGQ